MSGKERRVKRFPRIEELNARARFYRWISLIALLAIIFGGFGLKEGVRTAIIVATAYLIALAASFKAYRLESLIVEAWKEMYQEDIGWLRWDALMLAGMATIALVAVVLVWMLE